ncbi:MAG: flagellar biosynthetic protein FliQ [Acidobacteria bacterium]|nr:flagellar biosynthetic protein FliQ [Acidobacteriota bacterium]MBI3472526.1 flagellar biosynthetic protein FliQ [Candidatus Solibacter usitatus]
MTPEFVVQIIGQALMAAFWLCAPLLLIGFAVGILTNLLQIVTSLQDAGFSTIPRLAAFFASFLLLLPYMLSKMTTYAVAIFGDLGRYAR